MASYLATDVTTIQVPTEEETQEGCLALHTGITTGQSQVKRGLQGLCPSWPCRIQAPWRTLDPWTLTAGQGTILHLSFQVSRSSGLQLQQVLNPSIYGQARHFLWKLQSKSCSQSRILKSSLNLVNLSNKKGAWENCLWSKKNKNYSHKCETHSRPSSMMSSPRRLKGKQQSIQTAESTTQRNLRFLL